MMLMPNEIDDGTIKEDFNELYRLKNGMPLRDMDKIFYPVCTLDVNFPWKLREKLCTKMGMTSEPRHVILVASNSGFGDGPTIFVTGRSPDNEKM
jgi:hypothetical protein